MKNTLRLVGVLAAAAFIFAAFIFINDASAAYGSCYPYSFTRDMKEGASGEDVTAMQKFLVHQGYLIMPSGASFGYFGSVTKKAVIKYQKEVNLTAEGYVGKLTRAKLWDSMTSECGNSDSSSQNLNSYYSTPVTNTYDINSDPYYSQPYQPIYPTAAQEAAMPVYYATLAPSQTDKITVKINTPKNMDLLVMDDYFQDGIYRATENFTTTITGGSGRYRSIWLFDNLSTPLLYDEGSNDTYYIAGNTRTMTHAFTGPTYWIASNYVMDDGGRRSATSSIIFYVYSKSLADKIELLNKSPYDSAVEASVEKDPEYLLAIKQSNAMYDSIDNHPAAKEALYGSYERERAQSSITSSYLGNARAQAELYYGYDSNRGFAGVCSDPNMRKIFASAEATAVGSVNCIDNRAYWRAFVTLKENGKFWCVDSQGYSIEKDKISGYRCD